MELEIKFKSVAWRWILNVFLVMIIVVIAVESAFCVFMHSFYLDRVKRQAEEYAQVFITSLSGTGGEEFINTSREYCEEFEDKDKLEIQILDNTGVVLFSTTGFTPTQSEKPDYVSAIKNGNESYWMGKSSAGERVICQSTLLQDNNGNHLGAVRWIVSLTNMNRHLIFICLIAIAVGLVILFITGLSGLFFVKSIVRPIRDVSNMARKIAMGDFNSKIEIQANNEVGELCDSINYMASELQQAEKMKNEFISSVSHELRTPLTAIRGWAETAKMSIGFDEATVNKGLDVVLSESERLRGLVEELLDFSRMQSGRLSMSLQNFNVEDVLEEAAEMYVELAKKQNVELSYLPSKEPIICHGDVNRIKQVFINIIDNALKYNQPGGQILIEQRTEDACVVIAISDTGVGIPAQDLDRVKEKFYKANKTVRGSGIGLAVADEIIKQHNGLLLVDSTEGIGTTVTVVLPIYEETQLEGEANEQV
ncbi:MAG: HAMP domain-containing histidine kinase [Clostridia bacterium]|nr:HAMP domain-containing histidine kinase [Clostridia bacterium]